MASEQDGAGAAPDPGPRAGMPLRAPGTVVVAAGLAMLEAAAVAVYAVVYTVEVLPLGDHAMTRALIAGGVVLFLLICAAALGAAGWSLLQLRHWPRSLLVVVQVIVLAIVLPIALDGQWLAWVAAAVCAATIVLVIAPSTTAAIDG